MNSKSSLIMPSRFKTFALALAVLSFLGFADAAYLTADHYLALPLPCSLTQGCDTVLTSKYAEIFGLPIALFGAFYYLTVLFMAIYFYTAENPSRNVLSALTFLVSSGFVVSLALVYLQFFVIKALCMYCLFSAALTLLLFITVFYLRKSFRSIQMESEN